jgi:hypothetical protein
MHAYSMYFYMHISIYLYKYLHIGDFSAQFSKLAAGLLTDKYVIPEVINSSTNKNHEMVNMTMSEEKSKDGNDDIYEKYIIAPRMFKQVI